MHRFENLDSQRQCHNKDTHEQLYQDEQDRVAWQSHRWFCFPFSCFCMSTMFCSLLQLPEAMFFTLSRQLHHFLYAFFNCSIPTDTSYETGQVYVVYMGRKQYDDPTRLTEFHHETLASALGRYI